MAALQSPQRDAVRASLDRFRALLATFVGAVDVEWAAAGEPATVTRIGAFDATDAAAAAEHETDALAAGWALLERLRRNPAGSQPSRGGAS